MSDKVKTNCKKLNLCRILLRITSTTMLCSCSKFYEDVHFTSSRDSSDTIHDVRNANIESEAQQIRSDQEQIKQKQLSMMQANKERIYIENRLQYCIFSDDYSYPRQIFGLVNNMQCNAADSSTDNLVHVIHNAAQTVGLSICFDEDIDISKLELRYCFPANDKTPFIQIVEALCGMNNLMYRFIGNTIYIEHNHKQYMCLYEVPFLNCYRNTENTIDTHANIMERSLDNKLNVTIKNDFWEDLQICIDSIIKSSDNSHYSINKHNGILSVYTSAKCHKLIRDYINKIKRTTSKQVAIEVKIMEVKLNNKYAKGINWGKLIGNNYGISFNTNTQDGIFVGNAPTIDNAIKAVEEFGSVRTICNPRITSMNNQPAILKIVKNHVYFSMKYNATKLSATSASDDNGIDKRELLCTTSTPNTIPIGVMLFLLPSIDDSTGKITMLVRPTISSANDYVDDPATKLAMMTLAKAGAAQSVYKNQITTNVVPITDTREISSVIQVNDGDVAILGGFIETKANKETRGVPIFNKIPIINDVTGNSGLSDDVYELVILIRVRIVE